MYTYIHIHRRRARRTAARARGGSDAGAPYTPGLRYKIPVFSDPDPGKS